MVVPMPAAKRVNVQASAKMVTPKRSIQALNNMEFTIPVLIPITETKENKTIEWKNN